MIKKRIICLLTIGLILGACVLIHQYCNRFQIGSDSEMSIVFLNDNTSFHKSLDQTQKQTVLNVLNNKKMYNKYYIGELSCGFTKDISIHVNDEILEIACDKCPYIRIESTGKYLILNDEEIKSIRDIFYDYGGFFPSV